MGGGREGAESRREKGLSRAPPAEHPGWRELNPDSIQIRGTYLLGSAYQIWDKMGVNL